MAVSVGKRDSWNAEEVLGLGKAAGLPDANPVRINAVLTRCNGDFDLALTALTMIPRPDWVEHFLTAEVSKGNGF